jgi:hypothetical protein
VQVKFEFGHGLMIFGSPFYFEKKGNFQFPFIISPTVVHIQLKSKISTCRKNTLVKFEFGHGWMIADRVIPLEL